MNERRPITPAEVARQVAALGVIINPATVWAFLRHRYLSTYPDRSTEPAGALHLSEDELAEWLDEFLDVVEAERGKLSRAMQAKDTQTHDSGPPT